MAWFVYMLRCGDDSLYTGYTDNLERRLETHQKGKGAKYTRSRLPVSLAYFEELPDKSAALRREISIKKLTRRQKLALIEEREEQRMEPMRRKNRQLPEEAAWEIVDNSPYAMVAMTTESGEPYCLPVNLVREERCLYFHGAAEGKKIRCLRHCDRVWVTCVREAEVVQERLTTLYASAMLSGRAEEVTDPAEKRRVLELLCRKWTPDAMDRFASETKSDLHHTGIWKITVEGITGKRNR